MCQDRPRIILGGMEVGANDPMPSALLALSYPEKKKAEEQGKLLTLLQNGTRPLKFGPAVYAGDTRIKVSLLRSRKDQKVLCQVAAKLEPRHLTYSFYAADYIPYEPVRLFLDLFEQQRNYVMTVAFENAILLERLHLVKYVVERRGL